MKDRLFVDTGAWLAFANGADPGHERVRALLRAFDQRLVTSNFIFDETVTLVLYRMGHHNATRVGNALRDGNVTGLVRASAEDEALAWELMCNRPDQTYSFTDCVSFEMMRRLTITKAATLDDDFRREGFEALP